MPCNHSILNTHKSIKNAAVAPTSSCTDQQLHRPAVAPIIPRLLKQLYKLNENNSMYVDMINIKLIKKAIQFTKKHHGTQMRESGGLYYTHPLEVASMVANYCFKTNIIIAAILHDLLEDTKVTFAQLVQNFSLDIANNVLDLTRETKNGKKTECTALLLLLSLANKTDLMLVKLMDRVHNMQTIAVKSQEKRIKIEYETRVYFLPLAIFLGNKEAETQLIELLAVSSLS